MSDVSFIRQRNVHDCGIAATAMAARVNYDKVRDMIPRDLSQTMLGVPGNRIRLMGTEISMILWNLDVLHHYSVLVDAYEHAPPDLQWQWRYADKCLAMTVDILTDLFVTGRPMMILRANSQLLGHWVYCEGGKVYDPALSGPYDAVDAKIQPIEVIVLNPPGYEGGT